MNYEQLREEFNAYSFELSRRESTKEDIEKLHRMFDELMDAKEAFIKAGGVLPHQIKERHTGVDNCQEREYRGY